MYCEGNFKFKGIKLIATLVTFKPYQDINLTFDVSFLKSGSVKVTPVDVSMSK